MASTATPISTASVTNTATPTNNENEGAPVDTADDSGGTGTEAEANATLRVMRGEPTPEEIAALLAVIATRTSSGSQATAQPKASAWTDRSRYVRPRLSHTPDGWRASAFPR